MRHADNGVTSSVRAQYKSYILRKHALHMHIQIPVSNNDARTSVTQGVSSIEIQISLQLMLRCARQEGGRVGESIRWLDERIRAREPL